MTSNQAAAPQGNDNFFSQDDWEFELDTLSDRSIESLQAHLAKAPAGSESALFLKSFLVDSQNFTFTPFDNE